MVVSFNFQAEISWLFRICNLKHRLVYERCSNFFQAYASGCNIVILSPKFERVQIIPGVCHDNIQISCLDCSVDSGKIAAAYANQIIVFEPTPLLAGADGDNQDGSGGVPRSGLDYWWVETSRVKAESRVASLAWNNEGNRLLTAGDYIQMWQVWALTQFFSVSFL